MDACEICERETGTQEPLGGWVYRDDLWSVLSMPGLEVPGWLVIELRRHAEGLMELTDDEAQSLGSLMKRVSGHIQAVAKPEKVYSMLFGERVAHVHVLLAARGEDVPADKRGPGIIGHAGSLADKERAATIAGQVRDALSSA